MGTPASVTSLHDRFKCALTHRYFIRLHMTILVVLVLLAGLLASRGLTHAGVRHMGIRYPIAVLFSYLVFFVLVRIWIAYVCRVSRSRGEAQSSSSGSLDVGDLSAAAQAGRPRAPASSWRGAGGSAARARAPASPTRAPPACRRRRSRRPVREAPAPARASAWISTEMACCS